MEKQSWKIKKEYILAGIAVGLFLLVVAVPFSSGKKKSEENTTILSNQDTLPNDTTYTYTESLENRLQKILEKIDGIGKVSVMVTLKSSEEQIILMNDSTRKESTEEKASDGGERKTENITEEREYVLAKNNSEETPVIIKRIMPDVEGVLIVCEGGDKSTIMKEVTDAVQALFDLPCHKIKVVKRV